MRPRVSRFAGLVVALSIPVALVGCGGSEGPQAVEEKVVESGLNFTTWDQDGDGNPDISIYDDGECVTEFYDLTNLEALEAGSIEETWATMEATHHVPSECMSPEEVATTYTMTGVE